MERDFGAIIHPIIDLFQPFLPSDDVRLFSRLRWLFFRNRIVERFQLQEQRLHLRPV